MSSKILFPAMTGRRILPLHPEPTSLSGQPYNNCRCTGPASQPQAATRLFMTLLCAHSVLAFGFIQATFPHFPPQLRAAKDAHLPRRESGAPGLFQKEKNNHYEKCYKLSSRNYHYHILWCCTPNSGLTFPFLGDKGSGIDSSKAAVSNSTLRPFPANSSDTSEPTWPQSCCPHILCSESHLQSPKQPPLAAKLLSTASTNRTAGITEVCKQFFPG